MRWYSLPAPTASQASSLGPPCPGYGRRWTLRLRSPGCGGEVGAHAAVQVVLGPGLPQVLQQVVGAHEVGPLSPLDGLESQCHGQVCLPHAGRAQEQDVAGFGYEGQVGQLLDLALVDGGLEAKVKLFQGALEGQVRLVQPASPDRSTACWRRRPGCCPKPPPPA